MEEAQIKYVAVNPEGIIVGPVGDENFVKLALCVGHSRITGKTTKWEDIEILGYTVRKAQIRLLEDRNGN